MQIPLGYFLGLPRNVCTFRKFGRLSRNTCRIHIFPKSSECMSSMLQGIYTDLHAKYPSTLPSLVTVDFQLALASATAKEVAHLFFSPAPLICFLSSGRNATSRESGETRDAFKNTSSTREINAKFVPKEMG